MRCKIVLIVLTLFLLLLSSATGSNVTIKASEGNGKDKYCFWYCNNTDELVFSTDSTNRVYIMFDLGSVPETAEISRAMLLFKYKEGGASSFQFAKCYTALVGWNEDDNMQPGISEYGFTGNFNNISCGEVCNNENDWFGTRGDDLIQMITSWITHAYPNNGFVINQSKHNFSAYSSETGNSPFLYLEYESSCDDLDGDGFGVGDCLGPQDCNDTNASINPNATEICNNVDDDCNENIDDTGYECKTCSESNGHICNESTYCIEDYLDVYDSVVCCPEECRPTCLDGAVKKCGSDVGACTMGYTVCDDNEWSSCNNETPPVQETCNNIDDDCDGIVDNIVYYLRCQCYNGSSPSEEVYDNKDNDCDGEIDEDCDCGSKSGYVCTTGATCPGTILNVTDVDFCCSQPCNTDCSTGQTKPCGTNIGACREGTISCVDGKWGNCTGSIGPGNETCNRIDDDCNGIIDDINGLRTVGSTKCQCVSDGTQFEELCNEIDDNCDGTIDESCITIEEACSDMVQNFDEEDIDCGGHCSACTEATIVCNLSGSLDTDCDGMPDYWEDRFDALDKNEDDAGLDPDNDGYTNYEEYIKELDPETADIVETGQESAFSPLLIGGGSILFVIAGVVIYFVLHRKPGPGRPMQKSSRPMPQYPSSYRPRKHIYLGNTKQVHKSADSIKQRISEKFR